MNQPTQPVFVSPEILEVERLYGELFTADFRRLPIREQLDRQARRLHRQHGAGDRAVVFQITCWHPKLTGHSAARILASPFSLDDARQTIAREYGFADWNDVAQRGEHPPDALFELAVDTLLAGELEPLRAMLKSDPTLVQRRSRYGHRAALLHYVGSNGVETHRQKVPMNLAVVARELLAAGADVNAVANIYGGEATVLALLDSSAHPHRAGVSGEVREVLVEFGARDSSS